MGVGTEVESCDDALYDPGKLDTSQVLMYVNLGYELIRRS